MAVQLNAELFVPSEACSPERAQRLVHALMATGLAFERAPDVGGFYWSDVYDDVPNRAGPSLLREAFDAYEESRDWAIEFERPAAAGEDDLELTLSMSPPHANEQDELKIVHLSLPYMPNATRGPTHFEEFAAITKLVAAVTDAWYGWAGSNLGLFNCSTVPIAPSAVAALTPQEIEWLNIFGPPYRDAIGLDRLLTAPAWRTEFIANGGVAMTLGPEPARVKQDVGRAVAAHLGVPVALPAEMAVRTAFKFGLRRGLGLPDDPR